MTLRIDHLCTCPEHGPTVARWIYDEFWHDVSGGYSVADLDRLLVSRATDPMRIPVSLIALAGDEPVGTVNLIDNDDRSLPELHPWLAAMVVVPAWRGRGVGSALVRALAAHAQRMGFAELFFGTDGPGFYERLGAQRHLERGPGFWIMRMKLAPG